MIRFACPSCQLLFEAPSDRFDAKFVCPSCGQDIRVTKPDNKTKSGRLLIDEPTPIRIGPAPSRAADEGDALGETLDPASSVPLLGSSPCGEYRSDRSGSRGNVHL